MTINRLSISWPSCFSLLGLSATITLAGCTSMLNVPAPNTTPIHIPATSNPVSTAVGFTQCPPFNSEKTMCTMQYDPVCVKVKTNSGIISRTAGNACSACGTSAAISHVKGECQ